MTAKSSLNEKELFRRSEIPYGSRIQLVGILKDRDAVIKRIANTKIFKN